MMDYLEIFGVVTGLLYLFLEIKKRNSMWIVGVFMASAYIAVFAWQELYAAMGLQIYYLVVSLYGWFQWKKNANESDDSSGKILLRKLRWKEALISISVAIGLFLLFAFLLTEYTGDPKPCLDSAITAMSALGTYWLSRSYIEQWLLWILANALSVYLYLSQGLYPTSGLYIVYFGSAVYGYYYWKRKGFLSYKSKK